MSLYRRFARSKKGMSTIFGGLFFVILILMGFNVMLWGFVQWDAYNRTIANMSQRDQMAISENIVPVNSTCDTNCKGGFGTLFAVVDNLGGESVQIASVYLFNVNGSGICQPTPCIASPSGGTGNIPAGTVNFAIAIPGIAIGSNSYHILLASTRGRIFSLYYPWRFNSLTINNNGGVGGQFVTNIGPLAIFYDTKSFNYTQGTQTTSQSAFCMPAGTPVVLWLKIANTSKLPVTLLTQTGLQAQAYGVNGFGQFAHAWILDPNSVNPATTFAYNLKTNNYTLAPEGPNGLTPASFASVRIGASGPGGTGAVSFSNSNVSWITFIGLYYLFNGQVQGQTIPFMDFVTSSPNCVA